MSPNSGGTLGFNFIGRTSPLQRQALRFLVMTADFMNADQLFEFDSEVQNLEKKDSQEILTVRNWHASVDFRSSGA
jgi:hypothetical protein